MKGLRLLTAKYVLLGLFIIGLIASSISLSFWFTSHIKNDATRINHAGRQRMRSFEMAWLLAKSMEEEGEKRVETLGHLKEEMAIFEKMLYALRDGSIKYKLAPLPQKHHSLREIDSLIEKWRSRIKPVLTKASEGSPEAFRQYNALIHGYVDEINIFVNHLEEDYKGEYMLYGRLRLAVVILSVLVFIVLAFFVRKRLVVPILELRDAAGEIEKGNLDVRVEAKSRDEIGELGKAFNSMARSRKQAEEALRESEERFRAVAQTAVDAIISADSSGKIISWNRGAQNIFGYAEEEILDKPVTVLIPERYREAHRKGMERFGLTGESRVIGKTAELCGLRKDSTELPLEISLATWKTGEEIFYTAIIRDITERKRMEEELEMLAITDRLTQAYNRTKLDGILESEIERTKRYNQLLSMMIFDIDHFKKVNDAYGHIEGDHVLKSIADIARENMRKTDYLIRWGGEEFIICAPGTALAGAKVLAERIRRAIESYRFDRVGRVTVSFGVTQFRKGDGKDEFVERADAALYKAKTDGRNRVEISI